MPQIKHINQNLGLGDQYVPPIAEAKKGHGKKTEKLSKEEEERASKRLQARERHMSDLNEQLGK
jgi:hypothetical protein